MRTARDMTVGIPLLLVVAVVSLTWLPAALAGTDAPPGDGLTLWQRSLEVQRLPDSRSEIVLTTTASASEVVTLHLHAIAILGPDRIARSILTRVTTGGPLQGSSFLSVEHTKASDDLWVYLPALGSPR